MEKIKEFQHLHEKDTTHAKHTLFVEDHDKVQEFDPVEHFDTVPELLDHPWNRMKKSELEHLELKVDSETLETMQKEKKKTRMELQSRLKREEQLKTATRELDIQKHLMGKGAKRKVGEDEKGLPIYKWKIRRSK